MERSAITHNLKIVKPHFSHVRDRVKDYDIRFDDRDYMVGDLLVLHEYRHPDKATLSPTGETITRKIKHILRRFKGLQAGYIVLGLE